MWYPREIIDLYLIHSPRNIVSIYLIIIMETEIVSPQFHVQYCGLFDIGVPKPNIWLHSSTNTISAGLNETCHIISNTQR